MSAFINSPEVSKALVPRTLPFKELVKFYGNLEAEDHYWGIHNQELKLTIK